MKKVDFDQYTDNYNDLLREGTGFFTEDESYFARYKVELARGLLDAPPRRILEFGCGIGRNIAFLRAAFPDAEVMGSDVSAKSIEIARRENPGVHFWTDGKGEDERDGFDFVFVAGVLHHIPPADRDGALRLVHRRLEPGGSLVVFEHNPYNPVTRRIVSQCPYDEGVVLLTPSELRARLAAEAFAVRRSGYSLFFPPRFKALAGLEPQLAWLPLGGQYWVQATRG